MSNLIRGSGRFGDLVPKEMGGSQPGDLAEQPAVQPPTIVPSRGRRSLVAQRQQEQALKVQAVQVSQKKLVEQAVQSAEADLRSIFEQRQQVVGQLAQQALALTDPTLLQQDVWIAAEQMRQGTANADAFAPSSPWEDVSVADITALMDGHFSTVDELISSDLAEG